MEQFHIPPSSIAAPAPVTDGAAYFPALPDLTPTYEKLVGQHIVLGKHAHNILTKATNARASIHPVYYAHADVTAVLRRVITAGLMDSDRLSAVLTTLEQDGSAINDTLDDLKGEYTAHVTRSLLASAAPCEQALVELGYTFQDIEVGYLCFDDDSDEITYSVHECINFVSMQLGHLSDAAKEAVVVCLRAFGSLASISMLSHECRDWELYYCIDALDNEKIKQLSDIDWTQETERTLTDIETIMGENAFADLLTTFEEYGYVENFEREVDADTVVERVGELLDEVTFDKLPVHNEAYAFNAANFHLLPERLAPFLDKLTKQKDRAAILRLLKLAETAMPFIQLGGEDLESATDITLWSQQYFYLDGYFEHVCHPRAEDLENLLMHTCEQARMVINPKNAAHAATFTNMQIGYLLCFAAKQIIGDIK
tara:strand:+ start:2823 stop:4103 length:1281 start_codon:yes stop_codon:yes gene_type:complete